MCKKTSKDIFIAQQEKTYNNLDIGIELKKDKKKLIQHFIDNEKQARLHNVQGLFYSLFHYEIHKVLKTKMTKLSEEQIIQTYYYRIKFGIWDLPVAENFSLFMEAVRLDLMDNDLEKNARDKAKIHLLFGIKNSNEIMQLTTIDYQKYKDALAFITQCNMYYSYANMHRKKLAFCVFLKNNVLLERIYQGVEFYFDDTFETAGSLLLLSLDTSERAKNTLRKLHKSKQEVITTGVLARFYKSVLTSTKNNILIEELYKRK